MGSFWGARVLPVILQSEVAECGLACLAMIASFYQRDVDLNGLRLRFGTSARGAYLTDIMAVASELGLSARPLRCEPEHLGQLELPCIAHWNFNHFVVIKAVTPDGGAVIHDPAVGAMTVTPRELGAAMTGIVLELRAVAGFRGPSLKTPLRLSDLWTSVTGWARPAAAILGLTVLLQLLAFAVPLLVGAFLQDVGVGDSRELLAVGALGVFLVSACQAAAEGARGWTVHVCEQSVSRQVNANLLRHLLRLPLDYFEKRSASVLVSRSQSIDPVQQALSQSVLTAVIDGAMAMVVALTLAWFSPVLAMMVLLTLAVYLAFVWSTAPRLAQAQREQVAAGAESLAHLYESVRAIRTIKLFTMEWKREAAWSLLFGRKQGADGRVVALELQRNFVRSVLFGAQLAGCLYCGARLVEASALTLGTLFTFLLMRQLLCDRTESLARNMLQLMSVRVHLERLADIVQCDPEPDAISFVQEGSGSGRSIRADELDFQYSPNEPKVLNGLSLDVPAGRYVAIVGPSGAGKSTLLKLLTGLATPGSGQVQVDGKSLAAFGPRRWREEIAVVEQATDLLAGTVLDNITCFDPNADMPRVEECCRLTGTAADIAALPLGYLSMVGEMGSTLSGGQRQRLLVARALYRRAKVIFLDEGTANLDGESERHIADLMQSLTPTRVVVAHRPELVRRADEILELSGGKLRSISWAEFNRRYGPGEEDRQSLEVQAVAV